LHISCARTASAYLLHAAIEAMRELIGGVLSAIMIAIGCKMGHTPRMVEAMSAKIVTVQEAEGHLLELIALVEKGEEIIIAHSNQPKGKLVPMI